MTPQRWLELGADLRLPAAEAQTKTYIVFGGKGMGKTNVTTVAAEEFSRNDLRFSWLDPVGVAWGLKHSGDGRDDGLPVLILGGIHGDLAITSRAGVAVADFVVDEDVSVIIDISRSADGRMWSANDKIEFVTAYCTRLFERQGERRRPIMQIIDEVGRFAPQSIPSGRKDLAACKDSIEQMVELGRNVGIGVWLTTQRSARIDKSVSELSDVMLAFQTSGPRSIGAIVDWFGEHITKERERELIAMLRQFERGTCLVVSPSWLRLEGAYEIRQRRTFDSSDTPVAGKENTPTGRGARLPDLDKYRDLFAQTIEEAEAANPNKLSKKITEQARTIERLERDIAELRKSQISEIPEAEEVEVEVLVSVVPESVSADLADVRSDVDGARAAAEAALRGFDDVLASITALNANPTRTRGDSKRVQERPGRAAPHATPSRSGPVRAVSRPAPERIVTALPPVPAEEVADVHVKAGARKMLTILCRQYPLKVTGRQLATLAGIRYRAGTYNSYLSQLNVNELIEKQDDFILPTARGWTVAGMNPGDVDEITTDEVLGMYRSKLKAGARDMLDVLVDAWPNGVAGEDLAERCEITYRMGTYNSYLSALNVNGLVRKDGGLIFANEDVLKLR